MNELHEIVCYNNLKFEYVGPTKDVSLYEYMDSEELFNAMKNNQIRFDDVIKRHNELLNKLSEIKIGQKKNTKQKEVVAALINFTFLVKKLLFF